MTAVRDTLSKVKTLFATTIAALTLVAGSQAAPPNLTALGYTVYADNDPMTGGGVCPKYRVTGYGVDLTFRAYNGLVCNEAGMEGQMQSFAAGHDERKLGFEHPAAVTARSSVQGKGYAVATNYAGPLFTVTGGCNMNQTVDAAGLVALDGSLATSAPCPPPPPPPPPAEEPPPTTTEPAPAPAPAPTDPKVTELETKVADLVAKVASLQAAVEAAWTALVDALAAGQSPWESALAARSAGMNALYGL